MSTEQYPPSAAGYAALLAEVDALRLRVKQAECFAGRVGMICAMVNVENLNQLHDWILTVLERGRNEC